MGRPTFDRELALRLEDTKRFTETLVAIVKDRKCSDLARHRAAELLPKVAS